MLMLHYWLEGKKLIFLYFATARVYAISNFSPILNIRCAAIVVIFVNNLRKCHPNLRKRIHALTMSYAMSWIAILKCPAPRNTEKCLQVKKGCSTMALILRFTSLTEQGKFRFCLF